VSKTPALDGILRNAYSSPLIERLQQKADFGWYVSGQVRVTSIEIKTSTTHEGEFIALLDAKLQATLDDMAAHASEVPFIDEILCWRRNSIARRHRASLPETR
jgi:hypothetical protein